MAHGCILAGLLKGTERRSRSWAVRKRDGVWGVYPRGQCCPAVTYWDHARAIQRAQDLALAVEGGR